MNPATHPNTPLSAVHIVIACTHDTVQKLKDEAEIDGFTLLIVLYKLFQHRSATTATPILASRRKLYKPKYYAFFTLISSLKWE